MMGLPTKFSPQGDLLPGICASLTYGTSQQLGRGLLFAFVCFFVFGATAPPVGQDLVIHEVLISHTTTHHSR